MFDTKDDVNLKDLKELHPALMILLLNSYLYALEYNLPYEITSLMSDRKDIERVSDSHIQGRAADISVKGWTDTHVHRFVYLFNRDYADIAAISKSDLVPRAAVYHDSGYGEHIHLQVRPDAPVHKFVSWSE